jgi:hypothetical protein
MKQLIPVQVKFFTWYAIVLVTGTFDSAMSLLLELYRYCGFEEAQFLRDRSMVPTTLFVSW